MDVQLNRRQFQLAALAAASGLSPAAAQTARPFDAAQAAQPPADVPWLGEIQRPPLQLPRDAPPVPSLLADGKSPPIINLAAWQRRRETIQVGWEQFLGTWEYPRRPPEYEVLSSDRLPRVTRRLIRYQSERNVPVEAYLLEPIGSAERVPGVLVLHSTADYTIRQPAGLEGDPAAAWGLRLAERGFVALCPRCFLWDGTIPPNYQNQVAAHAERHPGSRGMAKMLYDARRALDLLASLEQVDPDRLCAGGHSLGAKETLYLAAFDTRVKAAVFSEGGLSLDFSNWDAPWYLGLKPPGHDHHELLGLIAPRPFLIVGGESADGARDWPLVARALDVYRLFGPTCRIGLYNHRQGHTIPRPAEGRIYEWLQAYV
ncbi:MAG: dienelactone hydrolase family protein [Pirellulales bacterium]